MGQDVGKAAVCREMVHMNSSLSAYLHHPSCLNSAWSNFPSDVVFEGRESLRKAAVGMEEEAGEKDERLQAHDSSTRKQAP